MRVANSGLKPVGTGQQKRDNDQTRKKDAKQSAASTESSGDQDATDRASTQGNANGAAVSRQLQASRQQQTKSGNVGEADGQNLTLLEQQDRAALAQRQQSDNRDNSKQNHSTPQSTVEETSTADAADTKVVAPSATLSVSTPAEATPAEATPAEATPAEATPAEATPAEATADKATADEATADEATTAEATTAEATTAKATTDEATAAEATPAEATADEATADEATADEATADEATAAEATPAEATPAEATTDEATTDEATTDEATAAEATTDETTTDEATTDEATAAEATTDETTTAEATTAEATTDKATTAEATTDKATTDKATTDKATTDEATTAEATTDEATADKAITAEALTDEALTAEAATADTTTDKATTAEKTKTSAASPSGLTPVGSAMPTMASHESTDSGQSGGIDQAPKAGAEEVLPTAASANENSADDVTREQPGAAHRTTDTTAARPVDTDGSDASKQQNGNTDQPSRPDSKIPDVDLGAEKNPPSAPPDKDTVAVAARNGSAGTETQPDHASAAEHGATASAHPWVNLRYPLSWGPTASQPVTPQISGQSTSGQAVQQTPPAGTSLSQNPVAAPATPASSSGLPYSSDTSMTQAELALQQAAEQRRIDARNNAYFTSSWFSLSLGETRDMNIESMYEAGDSIWKNNRFAAEEKATKPKESQ